MYGRYEMEVKVMKKCLSGFSLFLFMMMAGSVEAATEVRLNRERLELPRHIILFLSHDPEEVYAPLKSRLEQEGFKVERGGGKLKSSVTVIKGSEITVQKNIKTYATPYELSIYYKKGDRPDYIEWIADLKDRRDGETVGVYKYTYSANRRGVKWSNARVIADMVERFIVTVFED